MIYEYGFLLIQLNIRMPKNKYLPPVVVNCLLYGITLLTLLYYGGRNLSNIQDYIDFLLFNLVFLFPFFALFSLFFALIMSKRKLSLKISLLISFSIFIFLFLFLFTVGIALNTFSS